MIFDIVISKRQSTSGKMIYRTINRGRIQSDSVESTLRQAQEMFKTFSNPSFIDIPDEVIHLREINLDWTVGNNFKKIQGILEYHGFGIFIIERTDLDVIPVDDDTPIGRYYTVERLENGLFKGQASQVLDESTFGYPFAIMESTKVILKETDGLDGFIDYQEQKKELEDLISFGTPFDYDTSSYERFIEGSGYHCLIFFEN